MTQTDVASAIVVVVYLQALRRVSPLCVSDYICVQIKCNFAFVPLSLSALGINTIEFCIDINICKHSKLQTDAVHAFPPTKEP